MAQAPRVLVAQMLKNKGVCLAMTATASSEDVKKIICMCDMGNPNVFRYSPITNNHMFIKLKRLPSIYGFNGNSEKAFENTGLGQLYLCYRKQKRAQNSYALCENL